VLRGADPGFSRFDRSSLGRSLSTKQERKLILRQPCRPSRRRLPFFQIPSESLSVPQSPPILTELDEKPRRPFVHTAHRRLSDGGVAARVPPIATRERAVAARGLRLATRLDRAGAQRRRTTRHKLRQPRRAQGRSFLERQ